MFAKYRFAKNGKDSFDVQTRSGARVQIDQYNTTGQNRTISITGTPEQIAEARRLILEKIKEVRRCEVSPLCVV